MSVQDTIKSEIQKLEKGSLLFPVDYAGIAGYDAVRKAFSRLSQVGFIIRLSKGIYLYPRYDNTLGLLYPSTEKIIEAIARRDNIRIVASGANALHQLGLTTQVPVNAVYLTDGPAREIRVGNHRIMLKKTSPRRLMTHGHISGSAVLAMIGLGKDQLSGEILLKIRTLLAGESPENIRHDLKLAPLWVSNLLMQKTAQND